MFRFVGDGDADFHQPTTDILKIDVGRFDNEPRIGREGTVKGLGVFHFQNVHKNCLSPEPGQKPSVAAARRARRNLRKNSPPSRSTRSSGFVTPEYNSGFALRKGAAKFFYL